MVVLLVVDRFVFSRTRECFLFRDTVICKSSKEVGLSSQGNPVSTKIPFQESTGRSVLQVQCLMS